MGNLIENRIISDLNKARTGRYEDNSKNRRLHRVGQEYGSKGEEKEDEKSSEKKDDNSRTIQALESKIEQMKKNKRIFVEQGGEARYNRALETLQSKLDSAKGEKGGYYEAAGKKVYIPSKEEDRKESARDKAPEKKEKESKDKKSEVAKYDEATARGNKKEADRQKRKAEKVKEGYVPVGGGNLAKVVEKLPGGQVRVKFYNGDDEWADTVDEDSQVALTLEDAGQLKGATKKEKAKAEREYNKMMDKRTEDVVDSDIQDMIKEAREGKRPKEYWDHVKQSLNDTLKNDLAKKKAKDKARRTLEALEEALGGAEKDGDLRNDFKNKFLENPALALTYSTLSDHGTSENDLVGKEVAKQVMGSKKFKEKFRKELSALGYAKYLGLTPYKYESTGFADNLKDFSSKEIAEKLNVKDGETKEFSLKDSFIRTPGMGNGSLYSYDKMVVSMKNGRPTVTLSGKYQSGYKDNKTEDIKEGIGVLSKNQKETVLNLIEDKSSEADDGKTEEKESFTRVKFDDLPNSGKVNLKKYLSGKRREKIDSQWKDAGKISDADLKKMEAGLVKKFNDSFDSSSKSQRAEDLYNIMKVKGELQKRGKEPKKTEEPG